MDAREQPVEAALEHAAIAPYQQEAKVGLKSSQQVEGAEREAAGGDAHGKKREPWRSAEQAVEKLRGAIGSRPFEFSTTLPRRRRASFFPSRWRLRYQPVRIRRPPASPAIAQACRYAVDGELDSGQHLLARRTETIQFQKLDLHVVERIEIGKAVAD